MSNNEPLRIPDLTKIGKRKGVAQKDLRVRELIETVLSAGHYILHHKLPEYIQNPTGISLGEPKWLEGFVSFFEVDDAIFKRDFLGLLLDNPQFKAEFSDIYTGIPRLNVLDQLVEGSLTRDYPGVLGLRQLLELPRTLERITLLEGNSEALKKLKAFAVSARNHLSNFSDSLRSFEPDQLVNKGERSYNLDLARKINERLLEFRELFGAILPIQEQLEHYIILAIPYALENHDGKRVRYCRPEFLDPEKREGSIRGAHNPELSILDRWPYPCLNWATPNDIHWGNDARHNFIVGPNSKGKSVYNRLIGLTAHFVLAGLYPFAESCELSPVSNILTCFDTGDSRGAGHFETGGEKVNYMLDHIDRKSLVLMDENSRGTEPDAEREVAKGIVDGLIDHGITFFGVCHDKTIYQEYLSRRNVKLLRVANLADYENRFRVWPTTDVPVGYGIEFARHLGIDPESVRDRLQRRLG